MLIFRYDCIATETYVASEFLKVIYYKITVSIWEGAGFSIKSKYCLRSIMPTTLYQE